MKRLVDVREVFSLSVRAFHYRVPIGRPMWARLQLFLLLALVWSNTMAQPDSHNGRIPFWLEVHANQQIDVQMRKRIADHHSGMLVVRLWDETRYRDTAYSGNALIAKLRKAVPDVPVLSYGWATRYKDKKMECTGSRMMKWLVSEPELQLQEYLEEIDYRSLNGDPVYLGDVRNESYRRKVVSAAKQTMDRYGTQGFSIDVALRTPMFISEELQAECCRVEPVNAFCRHYADGMDSLFKELKSMLGERKLVYNGIWNLCGEMVENQMQLLAHADGALIEYFGVIPYKGTGSFKQDIAPYLSAMDRLAPEKRLSVYGRGIWSYEDYEVDYQRQRYLYGAYLLAARPNTAFKYHSSFQIPAHAGRSGGLDIYADALIDLGPPLGPRRKQGTLLTRAFTNGLVAVSPEDDGKLETIALEQPMYTPEGEELTDSTVVAPGSALILLNAKPPLAERYALELEPLADWSDAQWKNQPNGNGYLELEGVSDPLLQGEHDLILDGTRSLMPFTFLDLEAKPLDQSSRLLVVAEVDDLGRRESQVVFCVGTDDQCGDAERIDAPFFRTPTTEYKGNAKWRAIHGPEVAVGEKSQLVLDGDALLEGTRYKFRRWAYMRIQGPWQLRQVELLRESSM